jgi:hypothetical protein
MPFSAAPMSYFLILEQLVIIILIPMQTCEVGLKLAPLSSGASGIINRSWEKICSVCWSDIYVECEI